MITDRNSSVLDEFIKGTEMDPIKKSYSSWTFLFFLDILGQPNFELKLNFKFRCFFANFHYH